MKIPMLKLNENLIDDDFLNVQLEKIKEEFDELSANIIKINNADFLLSEMKDLQKQVIQEALDLITATVTLITHFESEENLKGEFTEHYYKLLNRDWKFKGEIEFKFKNTANKLYSEKELINIITRNLIAWDNSKDKSDGMLPEVYFKNQGLYKRLTNKDYTYVDALKIINT
jgi:hypothetical protein